MKPLTRQKRQPLETALRALEKGGDTVRMDAFIDELFRLAEDQGKATCTEVNGDFLRVQTGDDIVCELPVLHAFPKLRTLCARLSVRCAEWSGKELSHYGDDVEFQHPITKTNFSVHFENTPVSQRIMTEGGR